MNTTTRGRLTTSARRWFRTLPRLHGETDPERSVSFLELFYDLVFVVIVGKIAHHLVGQTTWGTVGEFATLFGLMWVAWMNGSLYHELHGREDGRHRAYIFLQMYLLVLLAVFAGHATGKDGPRFALAFAALMVVVTYQWWVVARHDAVEVFRRSAQRYLVGMILIVVLVTASAFLPGSVRLALWAGAVLITVVGYLLVGGLRVDGPDGAPMHVTESMVERFNLFTIIVLGEVVAGVINGIIEADAAAPAVIVGLLAMTIGFGMWWNYFDALGARSPRDNPRAMVAYLLLHLPLHGAIAAAGGGMVGLIEHGADGRLDAGTAWLLCGATALVLVLIAALLATLEEEDLSPTRLPIRITLVAGALVALALGFAPLTSTRLAGALAVVLAATWCAAFVLRSISGEHERMHNA